MLDWPAGQVTGVVEAFHSVCHGKLDGLPFVEMHA
jgi:hypothetical protein